MWATVTRTGDRRYAVSIEHEHVPRPAPGYADRAHCPARNCWVGCRATVPPLSFGPVVLELSSGPWVPVPSSRRSRTMARRSAAAEAGSPWPGGRTWVGRSGWSSGASRRGDTKATTNYAVLVRASMRLRGGGRRRS